MIIAMVIMVQWYLQKITLQTNVLTAALQHEEFLLYFMGGVIGGKVISGHHNSIPNNFKVDDISIGK